MKIKIAFLFALLMIVLSNQIFAQTVPPIEAGVSRELARWRAERYENVRYRLNLTLEKGAPTLKGSIEIKVNLRQSGKTANRAVENDSSFQILDSQPTIVLDWRKIRGKENFSTISNVSINGRFLVLNTDASKIGFITDRQEKNYFEFNEHLVFQDGVNIGENVIKLDFTSPIATSGAAVTRYVDKEDGAEYIYSLFVPSDASTAFPCFDQPDLKARFTLAINTLGRATKSWKVVSNTQPEVSFSSTFGVSYKFKETQPISTYVFAFAAGEFATFTENGAVPPAVAGGLSQPLGKPKNHVQPPATAGGTDFASTIYVRKSQAEKFKPHAPEIFRLNREAVKYLEGYFDYKFPFPKYDLVLIPEFPFGGMEHAGATFLRESSVIFPQEPTANDYISRGNLIFHEAAHQWFGDTVTMRWFDDLWLKEGFAEFMAYKTMEKVLPQYNAWKAFYERNKPLAYLTDASKGTTPIYQEIPNLSAAKCAYGNIVYRKAPAFLRQAEFYLGEDKFQSAVRAFLKQNAFKNAEWQDLIKAFEKTSKKNLSRWAEIWVKQPSLDKVFAEINLSPDGKLKNFTFKKRQILIQPQKHINFKMLLAFTDGTRRVLDIEMAETNYELGLDVFPFDAERNFAFLFPNYQDYGYGIFLLDKQSRDYVLQNIQNEKDPFLRAMMWGALWDSVRETELNPRDYVELAIKNIGTETDELTINTILGRVGTAMNYYLSVPPAVAGGLAQSANKPNNQLQPPATAGGTDFAPRLERVLLERLTNAETLGQRIVFYRAFLQTAATDEARQTLKNILDGKTAIKDFKLKTKDRFDIVTRLLILGDKDAEKLLTELEKTETSDEARRYAYAARAGIATAESKQKYFNDFLSNKDISESWIEAAFVPFNASRHSTLTAPFLERALQELPNLKRSRKIFFVNGWLAAFIGGQRDEKSLAVVNKFLADNPNLDKDLRLKILEVSDGLERSLKIRGKFSR